MTRAAENSSETEKASELERASEVSQASSSHSTQRMLPTTPAFKHAPAQGLVRKLPQAFFGTLSFNGAPAKVARPAMPSGTGEQP